MNKKGIIILIVFLSVVCVSLTGGFIYLLSTNFEWGSFNISFDMSDGKLIDSVVYENDVETIVIDSKRIDVFVEKATDNKITLEVYSSNKSSLDYSFNNNDKTITFKAYNNKVNNFIGISGNNKIIVKIPEENSINSFLIDAKVGDIKVGDFKYLNGKIKNTVGDLDVDGFNNLTIDLGTGDINLHNVNSVDIKHTTGDLEIDTVGDITNDSKTGDIKIGEVSLRFNIKSNTGDITINNASLTGDSVINHKTGDIRIKKLTGVYVETDSKIGDVKINNNDRYAEHTLKITNKTGDIRIN